MVKAAPKTKNTSRKSTARAASSIQKPNKTTAVASTKTVQDALQEVLKPRRALTAYNLFTGLERERILNGTDQLGLPVTAEDVYRISLQHKEKKRRQHRKSHGVIGFQELSKTIAQRWKALPEEQRKVFEHQAELEKLDRQARLRVWKAQERKAKKAQASTAKAPAVPTIVPTTAPVTTTEEDDEASVVPKDASSLQAIVGREALMKMKGLVEGKVAALLEMGKLIDQKLGMLEGEPVRAAENAAENMELLEEAGEMLDAEFAALFDQAEGALKLEEGENGPLNATQVVLDHFVHMAASTETTPAAAAAASTEDAAAAGSSLSATSDSDYEYASSSGDEADSYMASLGPIQMECL